MVQRTFYMALLTGIILGSQGMTQTVAASPIHSSTINHAIVHRPESRIQGYIGHGQKIVGYDEDGNPVVESCGPPYYQGC